MVVESYDVFGLLVCLIFKLELTYGFLASIKDHLGVLKLDLQPADRFSQSFILSLNSTFITKHSFEFTFNFDDTLLSLLLISLTLRLLPLMKLHLLLETLHPIVKISDFII